MELEDYWADFNNSIATVAQTDGNYQYGAFLEVCAEKLADAQEVSDLVPSHFEGVGSGRRTIRLDGLVVDDADGSLVVLIGDYRETDRSERLTTSDAQKHFKAAQAFIEDAVSGRLIDVLEESSEAYRTALRIKRLMPTTTRIRFYLVTNSLMSERIKGFPPSKFGSTTASYHIWDIARFFQASIAANGREDLVVDLTKWLPDGLAALPGGSTEEGFSTYLAVLPGQVLADMYRQYGSRILEGNVRSFLSTKVKVNRGIRATLAQNPHQFLAFNNGLTCTASSVQVSTNGSSNLTALADLQIVNGGQTTASLATFARDNSEGSLDGVYVQVKLVVVQPEKYEALVPSIAKFANSQNAINDADFFSNSPYHRRLEDLSRRVLAPAPLGSQVETYWFYERARGQYANEKGQRSVAERRKFEAQNPRSQLIVKTDVAKYLLAWDQRPHDVGLGAQKGFVKFAAGAQTAWELKPDEINELYFKTLVAKAIVFSSARRRISQQPWYETGGYLGNLATYSVAKLAHSISNSVGTSALDFRKIWATQSLGEPVLLAIDSISEGVQSVFTSSKRGSQNVSEWAKKPECWEQVRELKITLPDSLADELVSLDDMHEAKVSARVVQKIDTGIEAQMRVLGIPALTWRAIRDSPEARSLLSPHDVAALKLVTGEVKGAVPEGFQVQRLLAVLNKAQEYGVIGES